MREQFVEVADPGSRQSLDRSGRDTVDANAHRTYAERKVTYARFQTRLGKPHHVVIRYCPHRTQIGHGDDSRVAPLHEWQSSLDQRRKTVGADVVGDAKSFPGNGVVKITAESFARRVCNGVDDAVEAIPGLAQLGKARRDLFVAGHIAGKDQLRVKFRRQPFDALAYAFALVGERQFGTLTMHGFGDTIRDRAVAQ